MLHGRDAERDAIAALLAEARDGRSGALVLVGDAGIGKSALLEDAVVRAEGMHVLRATGVEAERELPYGTLHQLLGPVLSRLPQIPAPQAAALAGALGVASGADGQRFLTGAATLSLLAESAEEAPVLCVVDDAQWVDDASTDALAFAARRLRAERIAVLIASRPGGAASLVAGLPTLALLGLDADAARALLDEGTGRSVGGETDDRVIQMAAGNPLALLELSASLARGEVAPSDALFGEVPLGPRLERAFLRQVDDLPEPTRRALLIAAADGTADLAVVISAARGLGLSPEALAPAERAGLIRVAGGRIEFRHPLIRAAVYQTTPFADRQSAHMALAAALSGADNADRRAWHRAAAAVGVDDSVASELEGSADRARHRGGHAAAAAALERAAELTEEGRRRSRRLVDAARDAWAAGRPTVALGLLDRSTPDPADSLLRADAALLRGTIEARSGIPGRAAEILLRAAEEVGAADAARSLQLYMAAGNAFLFAGDVEGNHRVVEAARTLVGTGSAAAALDGYAAMTDVIEGHTDRGAPVLRRVIAAAAEGEDREQLRRAGVLAMYLQDEPTALSLLTRSEALARRTGALGELPYILEFLALVEFYAQRFSAARAHASEGLALARETGQLTSVCRHLTTLAFVAAVQGRDDECRTTVEQTREHAARHGLGLYIAYTTWVLALLDLGRGRSAEVVARLEGLVHAAPGSGRAMTEVFAVPDLVEAAVRSGRQETAEVGLARFERWATGSGTPSALALLARCRALLAGGIEEAQPLFEEAVALHPAEGRPFDLARTRLLYGEALRRARRRADARVQLRGALDDFERLGAEPWAERARDELRVSGETARRRDVTTIDQLTPQEIQISRLVAEGATNREIGAKLFLSPRTIDYHLHNIFGKLEISSRAELIRLQAAGEGLSRAG